MGSALLAKSWTDLTRRKARASFAIATLALAIASIGIFAVAPLMNAEMRKEVAANKLADLTVETRPLQLDRAALDRLGRLPNVTAVQPRSFFATRMYIGARRETVYLIGVPDFRRQSVDVVRLVSGRTPSAGAALTEVQNAKQDRFAGSTGDSVRIIAADGSTPRLRIGGEGHSLDGAQDVVGDKVAVLYTTPRTVAALSGRPGVSSLAFRLRDSRDAAVRRTTASVQRELRAADPSFTGFAQLPEVREPGSYPGKEAFDDVSTLFTIVTVLAVLSGMVLVSSTMSMLVAEQAGEIATMKAIGGRRRQIAAVYLRTALLLGALSLFLGIPAGVLLAGGILHFFASTFYAIDTGLGINWPVVAASAAFGLVAPALAALPAIRRGVRLPLRDALEGAGVETAGGRIDRALLRLRRLPRTAQIGLRNVGRRRRRSIATALIVAVAVGNLLGVMALASGTAEITRGSWDDRQWDVLVGSSLRRPLDANAERIIRSTPGVAQAEPAIQNEIKLRDRDAFVYGTGASTMFRYKLVVGRWYSAAEDAARARVVVLERGIARAEGIGLGDRVDLATGAGRRSFRVIGIASNQQENGSVAFVPLATAQAALGTPDGVNQYWIRTSSRDHGQIDRVTTRVEDALTAHGYEVGTEITYVGERDNVAENRTITTSIGVLGFIVVAISMVGLVNTMTMSVLERTREVGILRCIGARARDIRRIFATEGMTLALIGWLAGVPLGYGILRALIWAIKELIEVDIPVVYPASHVVVALIGTIVLALVVIALPLRRAARLEPGEALRYA